MNLQAFSHRKCSIVDSASVILSVPLPYKDSNSEVQLATSPVRVLVVDDLRTV